MPGFISRNKIDLQILPKEFRTKEIQESIFLINNNETVLHMIHGITYLEGRYKPHLYLKEVITKVVFQERKNPKIQR